MSASVSDTQRNNDAAVDAGAAAAAPAPTAGTPFRRWLFLIVPALLLVAVVAGERWWTYGRFMQNTDDAYLKADSVTVAPKVSGYVTDVYVVDNETVSAGQPLVRMDSRLYQAALAQATATSAARKADIARGQADLLMQQATIAQSRAQLQGARASNAYAIEQVGRYEPLVSSGAESDERLAELRNIRDQSAATLAADAAALQASERQIASTQAQIEQARAQLEAAAASAQQTTLDVQDTVVRSTLAGRVGDRAVRVGQYAQPGTRFMTIVPVQDIYLEANFKETQIGLMRPGQRATIHVDALSGTDLHGTVVSLSPGTGSQFALLPAQNATGNFTKIVQRVPVRIRIDADPETRKVLVPGLSVSVQVDTRSGREGNERLERRNSHG
jgi:membrane fusion protein (multidrug efflux system)